jgi:hypothetical protein
VRLSTALNLPAEVRSRVAAEVIAPLRAQLPGVRWMREETLHLTLLCERDEAGRAVVLQAAGCPPFRGLAGRGPVRASAIWRAGSRARVYTSPSVGCRHTPSGRCRPHLHRRSLRRGSRLRSTSYVARPHSEPTPGDRVTPPFSEHHSGAMGRASATAAPPLKGAPSRAPWRRCS